MNDLKINLDLIFDVVALISVLIATISGYKLGFLQSLFKTIGYIAGGVTGVFIAANFLSEINSIAIKVLISVVIILLSAVAGQFILGKIGLLIHKGLLFAPFKAIDSLLGSLLSAIKTAIIFYIIATLLLATSWQLANDYIKDSKFYTAADKYLPRVITDIKIEAKRIINL
jgi:uncharacterized membrane protein required for colicin V production